MLKIEPSSLCSTFHYPGLLVHTSFHMTYAQSSPDDRVLRYSHRNHLWIHLLKPLPPLAQVTVVSTPGHEAVQCTGQPGALPHQRSSSRLCLSPPPSSVLVSHKMFYHNITGLIHSFTGYAKDIFCKHTQKILPRKVLFNTSFCLTQQEKLHPRIKYAPI